jgi:proliferating cell nuclear antigen
MKLMDIDTDTLGIPDTEYDAKVLMPSSEFQRICRDLSQLGESVRIEVSKEGVRFASDGEAANGSVLLKATEGGGGGKKGEGSNPKKEKVKKEADAEDEEMKEDEGEVEEDDGGSFKAPSPERDVDELDSEKEQEGEDEEGEGSKKRKRKANGKPKASKKTKKEVESVGGVSIQMNQTVNLTFSLKYLVNFAKSGALAGNVQLMMSNEVPLLVSVASTIAPSIGLT